jgi:hypothetical protein
MNLFETKIIFIAGPSRSGTTLLSSLISTDKNIETFAEFILPVKFLSKNQAVNLFNKNIGDPDEDSMLKIIKFLKKYNFKHDKLVSTFDKYFEIKKKDTVSNLEDRLIFSVLLAQNISNKNIISFKLNNSAIETAYKLFPNSYFIICCRNPKNIIKSQLKNGHAKDSQFAEMIIQKYYNSYFKFKNFDKSNSCSLFILEIFLLSPQKFLNNLTYEVSKKIRINPDLSNISNSPLLNYRHKNNKIIKSGIDATKINFMELNYKQESKNIFEMYNENVFEITKKNNQDFSDKRKFNKNDYISLIKENSKNKKILTLRDLKRHCLNNSEEKDLFFLRHDVDHDLDNAIKMAEIDKSLEIKATYCILHSATYYGKLNQDHMYYEVDRNTIESVKYIQSLGHEINFHNNLLSIAIRNKIDYSLLLKNELNNWYNNNVFIVGTSTHGDKLCREYSFRNWEIFKKCNMKSDNKEYLLVNNYKIPKRKLMYEDFFLEYEAYEFPKIRYISDSGGVIREKKFTKAHTSYLELYKNYNINGVLTHPIWWDLKN